MPNVYCNKVVDYWIGDSVDEVIVDYERTIQLKYDPDDCGEWVQVPDDEIIRIRFDDPPVANIPQNCTVKQIGDTCVYSAKAKDWAATNKGFLCSTEY